MSTQRMLSPEDVRSRFGFTGFTFSKRGQSIERKEVAAHGKAVAMSSIMKVAAFCATNTPRDPFTGKRGANEFPKFRVTEMQDRWVDDVVLGRTRIVMFVMVCDAPHDPLQLMLQKDKLMAFGALGIDSDEYKENLEELQKWAKTYERRRAGQPEAAAEAVIVNIRNVLTIQQQGGE